MRPGGAEDLLALEEERPQLGEEERVALVGLDLRPVGLDLREVGVEREVGREVRRHAVLHVHAEVGLRGVVDVAAVGQPAHLDGGGGRQHLQVAAHRQVTQAADRPHLRQLARDAARHRGPDHRLVFRLQGSADLEPPAVLALAARRIAQALERDGHLRRPAVVDDSPARFEQRVPGPVAAPTHGPEAAAPAPQYCVPLDAVGVHREAVGPLLVEEGVEDHRDPVVAPGLVAVDPVGAHLGRVAVVGVEGEIEVVGVVGDADLGPLGRGRALDRVGLDEVGHEGRRAPDRVVEAPVHVRGLVRPERADGWPRGEGEPGSRSALHRRRRLAPRRRRAPDGRWCAGRAEPPERACVRIPVRRRRGGTNRVAGRRSGVRATGTLGSPHRQVARGLRVRTAEPAIAAVAGRAGIPAVDSRPRGEPPHRLANPLRQPILEREQNLLAPLHHEGLDRRHALHVDQSRRQAQLAADLPSRACDQEIRADFARRCHQEALVRTVSSTCDVGDRTVDDGAAQDPDSARGAQLGGEGLRDADPDPVVVRRGGEVRERNDRDGGRPLGEGGRGQGERCDQGGDAGRAERKATGHAARTPLCLTARPLSTWARRFVHD